MILKQFYLGCLAHASYLLADAGTRTAVVVDPQRDVDIYLAEAVRLGVVIRYVFLTHFHADFLAGHLELRERTGAVICLGARASAEYPFRAFGDGESLPMGCGRIQVLHTPGHTPESITLLLFDADRGAEPFAALTGDTLFIGDVGRPDLRAALGWSARDLGSLLYDSLHRKLLPLPDATQIYPAHGAGSLCGKNISRDTVSTMGEQRRLNYALQPMSREQFLAIVLADQSTAPDYFTYDAVLNTREHASLEAALERGLQPLSLDQAANAVAAGAQLLDTRTPADFARAHWRGATHIALDGQFATWCGTLLHRERPIVIVANPGQEREAGLRLGRIGFDHLAGFLGDGMAALAVRPDLVAEHARMSPRELSLQLLTPTPPVVVDVRSEAEFAAGAIPGAVHFPLAQWLGARRPELTAGRTVVVYCQGGYRSSIAASLLQAGGYETADLEGGYSAWSAQAPVQG